MSRPENAAAAGGAFSTSSARPSPRDGDAVHTPDDRRYDVFISYTTRRDRFPATELARYLTQAGYAVWFDESILGRRSLPTLVDKDTVCGWLQDAISRSRCVLLYLMQASAIANSDIDVPQALESKQAIWLDTNGEKLLVAWSWQAFEMLCAKKWFSVSGMAPGDVVNRLIAMGLQPRLRVQMPAPHTRGFLEQFRRNWSRDKRVGRLVAPLVLDDSDKQTFESLDLQDPAYNIASQYSTAVRESTTRVVVATSSARITSALATFATYLSQYYTRESLPYVAHLPEDDDDLGFWTLYLKAFPVSAVFLIPGRPQESDDIAASQAPYYEQLLKLIWESNRDAIICMPQSVAEALLTREYPQDRFELAGPRVEMASVPCYLVREARCSELNVFSVSQKLWEKAQGRSLYCQELGKLVTTVPVPASLGPVPYPELPEIWCDRRILTEELVSTITRECGRIVDGLDGNQEVEHRTVDVFRRWTGFSARLLKPFPIVSTPAWRVISEFAQRDFRRLLDGGLSERDALRLCSDLHVLYGKNSVPVLGVPPGADVAAVAKWVAGILFGNPDAVLHLDYGKRRLQNLSHLPTDELSLALAMLERYPFWVIAVTSFTAAPSNDVYRLRELTDTEMYEPPDDARSPKRIRRALIVSDTPTAFHKYATVFQMNPPDPQHG